MTNIDFIFISQSEVVNYAEYSQFPLERLPLFKNLIYPRMVYYKGGFRSHLDILNQLHFGSFWEEAALVDRRHMYNIWNFPGFNGTHMANCLLHFGINTYVINNFDAEWDQFCQIYDRQNKKPLIGISTTFHLNYSEIGRIIKKMKEAYKEISIVLGGSFINSEMNVSDPATLMKMMLKYSIDFAVCSYNSEMDLKDLLLKRKGVDSDFTTVNNLLIRDRSANGNSVFATNAKWNSPLLEDAPLLWTQLELPFLNGTIQLRTSSGCPFSCAFCSYPKIAQGFHTMPVTHVDRQLQCIMSRKDIKRIIFIDDTFNVPVSRFKDLCGIFSKYDFEWFSFLRVQYVDDEVAKRMKDSGCRGVYLGLESANNTILTNMNKRANSKNYADGIKCLRKADITTLAAFVLGFPGETEATIRDDVRFIEEVGIDFYTLKEFYYMKNTSVNEEREQFGLTGLGNRWSHNTMDSDRAYEHKIAMFKEIKNSVFLDSDTSLWYLAYLYGQGFAMSDIASIQRSINALMGRQLDGHFNDDDQAYGRISEILEKRGIKK